MRLAGWALLSLGAKCAIINPQLFVKRNKMCRIPMPLGISVRCSIDRTMACYGSRLVGAKGNPAKFVRKRLRVQSVLRRLFFIRGMSAYNDRINIDFYNNSWEAAYDDKGGKGRLGADRWRA